MQIIITIIFFIIALLLLLPTEFFYSRNLYKKLINKGPEQILRTDKLENKALEKLVKISGVITKIIPVKVSDKRQWKIKQDLAYIDAGSKISPMEYIGIKYITASICFTYFLFFYLSNPETTNLMLLFVSLLVGYYIPDNMLSGKVRKRRENMEREVPAILSSLAITTDAGLNLMQAIEEVTIRNKGEMAKELKKTLEEIRLGISQKQALEKMAERCNVDEISYFISSLIQALEKGSSGITVLLRDQAKESWNKRKERAKELAEKASIKLFMPLLLLVFPAFTIFLLAPMIFSIMDMMGGK